MLTQFKPLLPSPHPSFLNSRQLKAKDRAEEETGGKGNKQLHLSNCALSGQRVEEALKAPRWDSKSSPLLPLGTALLWFALQFIQGPSHTFLVDKAFRAELMTGESPSLRGPHAGDINELASGPKGSFLTSGSLLCSQIKISQLTQTAQQGTEAARGK